MNNCLPSKWRPIAEDFVVQVLEHSRQGLAALGVERRNEAAVGQCEYEGKTCSQAHAKPLCSNGGLLFIG